MENNITNKELFYNYAESLGIKINDAQRLMVLALASREEVLPQADVIKNVLLPAGTKWIERQYYCKNFSLNDYERCGDYMKKQNDNKHDYIIIKIEYNPMKSTCKFIDKVRL